MQEHIKNKGKALKKQCFMMGAFFLIVLFLQLFLQTGLKDDAWYAKISKPLSMSYLIEEYKLWTSRLFIEIGTKLLTTWPHWIWRALNIFIVLLLVWIVADLFGIEQNNTKMQAQVFFFVLMWSVPVRSIGEAGWITTTLNYLWPLTLGLVAMRPIKHWIRGERCPGWEYIVCPLCLLLGANTEQAAALLLGTYLVFGAYILKKKGKLCPFFVLLFFLAAASVVFALTAPGNRNRAILEMKQLFPEFADLNGLQKFHMGFLDTVSYYFSAGGMGRDNDIFALLTGILLVCMWQKRTEKGFRIKVLTALGPFLFCWVIGRLGSYLLLYSGLRHGGYIIGLFSLNRCLPIGAGIADFVKWLPSYPMPMVLMQTGVYLVLLVCVALTVYYLHGRSEETLFELLILGAGLLSRLIIGFSPTCYASGERTLLYCSAAVLIVCLRNLQFFWNSHAKKFDKGILAAYVAVIVCINFCR